MSNGTEPAEKELVEPGGLIDDWEALDPRDRTDRSIVERVFQRILDDMRIFQKNKKPPEEN